MLAHSFLTTADLLQRSPVFLNPPTRRRRSPIGFGMVPHSQRTLPLIPSPPPSPNPRDNHIFSQMREANQHLGKKPLHPFGVDLLRPFPLGDERQSAVEERGRGECLPSRLTRPDYQGMRKRKSLGSARKCVGRSRSITTSRPRPRSVRCIAFGTIPLLEDSAANTLSTAKPQPSRQPHFFPNAGDESKFHSEEWKNFRPPAAFLDPVGAHPHQNRGRGHDGAGRRNNGASWGHSGPARRVRGRGPFWTLFRRRRF